MLKPVDHELRRDLWPEMQKRIRSARPITPLDWALIAAVLAAIALSPHNIFVLLYHL